LRCPCCQNDLELTCPNRCANAHEGAHVGLTPAQAAPAPRGKWTPAPDGQRRHNGQTRASVLGYLATVEHASAAAIGAGAGIHPHLVHQMLAQLRSEKLITKTLPPGRKRGAIYRVVKS
jgi:hypothetical protein